MASSTVNLYIERGLTEGEHHFQYIKCQTASATGNAFHIAVSGARPKAV